MENELFEKFEQIGKICEGGFLLSAKIVANSKNNSCEIIENSSLNGAVQLKIKISKPAVEGAANAEIIKYLAKLLNVGKNNISIVKGKKSSIKTLFVQKP